MRAHLFLASSFVLAASPMARAQPRIFAPSEPVGIVSGFFGEFRIRSADGTQRPAVLDALVRLGDTIETSSNSRARCRITLDDDFARENAGPTTIYLASATTSTFRGTSIDPGPPPRLDWELELSDGAIRIHSHGWSAMRYQLRVRTPSAECLLREGEMMVRIDGEGGKTYLTTLGGRVATRALETTPAPRPNPSGPIVRGATFLASSFTRFMGSVDPSTWRDVRLSTRELQSLIDATTLP